MVNTTGLKTISCWTHVGAIRVTVRLSVDTDRSWNALWLCMHEPSWFLAKSLSCPAFRYVPRIVLNLIARSRGMQKVNTYQTGCNVVIGVGMHKALFCLLQVRRSVCCSQWFQRISTLFTNPMSRKLDRYLLFYLWLSARSESNKISSLLSTNQTNLMKSFDQSNWSLAWWC